MAVLALTQLGRAEEKSLLEDAQNRGVRLESVNLGKSHGSFALADGNFKTAAVSKTDGTNRKLVIDLT